MAEKRANHRKRLAGGCEDACIGVSKIVNADAVDFRGFARARPEFFKRGLWFARGAGEQEGRWRLTALVCVLLRRSTFP